MSSYSQLHIMPKEVRSNVPTHGTRITPYSASATTAPRTAAIWNAEDDDMLLRARATGLNWGPIATNHFPHKTANACRKRHERLAEKRSVDDWPAEKIEHMAILYMDRRKEMWDRIAIEMGERWSVIEAKCQEKGPKNLAAIARAAERRAANGDFTGSFDEQSMAERNSDSGVELMEMAPDNAAPPSRTSPASWHACTGSQYQGYQDHHRSHSLPQPLPQPLPLYRPPPPPLQSMCDGSMTASPAEYTYSGRSTMFQRYSPEFQNGRGGISIQAVLSPVEPPQRR